MRSPFLRGIGEGITSIIGFVDTSAVNEQLGLTFTTVFGQVPNLAVGAVRTAI